jgi:hypothetical protein
LRNPDVQSLEAREIVSSQGDRHEFKQKRRQIFKSALLAAGIAVVAVSFLCVENPRQNVAHQITGITIPAEEKANAPRPGLAAGKNRPHRRFAPPEKFPPDSSESVSASPDPEESQRTRHLSWTFQYADLDCQMLPATQARSLIPEGMQSGEMVGQLLRLHDGTGFSNASLPESYYRVSITNLKYFYDKTDVWNVLSFVRHLDSLNLETGSTTLFDEYAKIWLEGGADAMLPDPNCMEKIAMAISLLRMARNDLSELLGKDPSMAPEVLGSLSEPARRIVLSGAVGVALADPGRPNIEDLFDFLTTEDKIALIKMYDSSLPDSERLGETLVGSLLSLPESKLWNLLSDRMDRFKVYSSERERIMRESDADAK